MAPTPNDEDSTHTLGEFNLQTMKYIRMQQPARNETNLNWMRQTWEFNSSASDSYRSMSCCGNAPHIKVATLCIKKIGKVSISRLGRLQSHNLDWIYFLLFAMAPYGVAFQLLHLVQCSARAHCAYFCFYTPAIWHVQWEPGWASMTVIPSLPSWLELRPRADCKHECPELDCLIQP
jgi:hypothetical protein